MWLGIYFFFVHKTFLLNKCKNNEYNFYIGYDDDDNILSNISEQDFIKKFKIVNSIVPISIALFANSSIVEKKK